MLHNCIHFVRRCFVLEIQNLLPKYIFVVIFNDITYDLIMCTFRIKQYVLRSEIQKKNIYFK